MKKNDLAAIILIVAISAVISYFIAQAIIKKPSNEPVEVEKVTNIEPTFPTPDPRVFNGDSVDPTVEIQGNNQSADQPFPN